MYKYFVSFSVVIDNQVRAGNGEVEVTRKLTSVADILSTERYLEEENGYIEQSLKINNFILMEGENK